MPKRKDLNEVREGLNSGEDTPVNPTLPVDPTPPAPGVSPGRGRPKGSTIKEKISEKTVENLIAMPFNISRLVTGYTGFEIQPVLKDDLVKSATQVANDFGLIKMGRYLNLCYFGATFVLAYGSCWYGYVSAVNKKRETDSPKDKTKEPEKK